MEKVLEVIWETYVCERRQMSLLLVALESVIFFVSLLLLFFYGCFVFKKER